MSPSLGCFDTGCATGGLLGGILLEDVPSDCVLAADLGERCAGTAGKLGCSPLPRANTRSWKDFLSASATCGFGGACSEDLS